MEKNALALGLLGVVFDMLKLEIYIFVYWQLEYWIAGTWLMDPEKKLEYEWNETNQPLNFQLE